MEKTVIDVRDVSFSYGNNLVLDKVSLQVMKGDFFAITGANGSGKSTLIRLILGLLKTQSGSITVLGEAVASFSQHAQLGYVAQKGLSHSFGFPASVYEVVGLPLKTVFSASKRQARHQKIMAALAQVNMQDFSKRMISELSGGQLQRVLIARELILNPKILFLDEPTNGLDSPMIHELFEILHTLNRKNQMTVLLITHSDEQLRENITHTILIEDHHAVRIDHGDNHVAV